MSPTEPTQAMPLPLTPAVFHILLALADGERHGYGIMQAIATFTEGTMRLGPGTLYRSLKAMLAGGLIVASEERPDPALDDERRRYYRLTEAGERAAATEVQRLTRLVACHGDKAALRLPSPTAPARGEA